MGSEKYVIRGGIEGRERLRLLSEVMGPSTQDLIAKVGVPSGSICLDVGCGGGDVTIELARAVGPTGRVIGVDLDEKKLKIARRECEEAKLTNIAFEVRDVAEWTPEERFDVVYARFLLTHLSQPGELLSVMGRYLNSGGVIIIEDIDYRGHFAEPECPALNRAVEWYTKSVQSRGADPNIGPRLPGLLRDAGFSDVQMRLYQPAALQGGMKLLKCVTLENIAEVVIEDGLATEQELQETIAELYTFARDPQTVLGGPRIFQVWGRMEN
ncbi:MAG: methyltransferase domain-containing protein [Thermosynechococcaceae cyanobacterium]